MEKETNMSEVVEEIKGASEDEIKQVIEDWFEKTRTSGMRIGTSYISAAIMGIIQKHTKKQGTVSKRDYERMTAEIIKIISVQLIQQNSSEEQVDIVEENDNDDNGEA